MKESAYVCDREKEREILWMERDQEKVNEGGRS